MRSKTNKKAYVILIIVLIGIICSLYFYNQLIHIEIPIHSDDAGSATDLRDIIEMGNNRWSYWCSPLSFINALLYYLLGPTEFFLQAFFSVKYFICISLAAYLALVDRAKKGHWWLIPLFVFAAMPGCFGDASIHCLKFHVWTTIVPLICLVYMHIRGDVLCKLGKVDIIILFLFSILGLAERDILLLVTCWMPFAIYWIILFAQRGYIKKYIRHILAAGIIALICGKLLFSYVVYTGYGASSFSGLDSVLQNIITGCTGLLSLWNVELIGSNILQFSTVIGFIRFALLLFAFWCIVDNIKKITVDKIENLSLIDSIMSISAVVLIVVYLFGGYREGLISVRYIAYIYYIFLVLMCRKLQQLVDIPHYEFKIGKAGINLLSLFFAACVICTVKELTFSRAENKTDRLATAIQKIGALECGMGSFWASGVVSVLSDYDVEIQAGKLENGYVIPDMGEWDMYSNGERRFNFFIEDPENDRGINEENIVPLYGEYIECYDIEDRKVYLYDYDIRTKPLVITPTDDIYLHTESEIIRDCIQMAENTSVTLNNIFLTVGKVRIEIRGRGLRDALEMASNKDVEIEAIQSDDTRAIFELTVKQLCDDVILQVNNISDKQIWIENICVQRLENCIFLPVDETVELHLTKGTYIIAAEGENIKNTAMHFTVNGEEFSAERIRNGRQKVAYQLDITEDIDLLVWGEYKGDIQYVYYQNDISKEFSSSDFKQARTRIFSVNNGILTNEKEKLLFGPYIVLEKGVYLIEINGEDLDKAQIKFTRDKGVAECEEVQIVGNAENKYVYYLYAEDEITDFEIVIQGDMQVNYYAIIRMEQEETETFAGLDYNYDSLNIFTTGKRDMNAECISLKKGEIIYGPYINMAAGTYTLIIEGDNLENVNVDVTYDSGKGKVIAERIESDEGSIVYEFNLDSDRKNVEFVIGNLGDLDILIGHYEIQKVKHL